MSGNSHLIQKILNARYFAESLQYLAEYKQLPGNEKAKLEILLSQFLKQIKRPELEHKVPHFSHYKIPSIILKNNRRVRQHVIKDVENMMRQLGNGKIHFEEVEYFFQHSHEFIKWSQNQWLVATPGINLELFTVLSLYHQDFLKWLKTNFGLNIGDNVVHIHVISNKGRVRLKNIGFEIPYEHWHEQYYKDGMKLALEMVLSWDNCKGVICDNSWVFNPENFKIAPDGKPFVLFSYLADDKLVGHRVDVTDYISKPDLEKQYRFALRSERRKTFEEKGEYKVKVFGIFYPRRELIENAHYFQ